MIKLEQEHLAKTESMTIQGTLSYFNQEIKRQFDELRERGVLTVKCEQHWPRSAGPLNDKPGVFYVNECGTCGKTIFPHSWVVADG